LCIFSFDLSWIMSELMFRRHYMLLKNEHNILYVWDLKKISSL